MSLILCTYWVFYNLKVRRSSDKFQFFFFLLHVIYNLQKNLHVLYLFCTKSIQLLTPRKYTKFYNFGTSSTSMSIAFQCLSHIERQCRIFRVAQPQQEDWTQIHYHNILLLEIWHITHLRTSPALLITVLLCMRRHLQSTQHINSITSNITALRYHRQVYKN